MKKVFSVLLLIILVLSACGSSNEEKTFDFTVDDLENRIEKALKEMGDKTNLKIISSEENEDKRQVITLSENIFFFVYKNGDKVAKVSLATTSDALITEKDDLDFAFLLLVGTVNDTLKYKERYEIVRELELNDDETNLLDHTKSVIKNNIRYTFKGENDSIVLQAEPK